MSHTYFENSEKNFEKKNSKESFQKQPFRDVLRKIALKIYKFTGEHPCRKVISVFSCKFAAYFQNTFL